MTPFLVNTQSLDNKKHWLLLSQSTVLDIQAQDALISVPVVAGIYGFASIEARDSAVRRLNQASTPDNVATAIQLLQHL